MVSIANASRAILITPLDHDFERSQRTFERVRDLSRMDLVWMPVIDSDSASGTREWLRHLAAENPWIDMLDRGPARGRPRAYIEGYRRARRRGVAKIVEANPVCDPIERVPEILDQLDRVHVVASSRWCKGGELAGVDWATRVLTKIAGWVGRRVLGMPFSDCLGGLQGFRREVLEFVDLDSLHTGTMLIRIELKYLCRQFRSSEISLRAHGFDGTLQRDAVPEARRLLLHLLADRCGVVPARRRHWSEASQLARVD